MLKSDEIRKEITAKVAETEKYRNEGKIAEAKNAAQEILKLKDELDVQLTLEKTKDEEFFASAKPVNENAGELDNATLCNRAFNKLVFGRGRLTDEERRAYFNVTGSPGQPGQIESIDAKGGYLVPEDQMRTLQEFRKAYVALKDYVTVVSTNTTSGRWPTLPYQQLTFQSFAEMTDIAEGDISFGEATYSIEDRGLIIPVSNQLIADADVDIMSVIGRHLAEGAVKAENIAILSKLNELVTQTENSTTTLTATTITSHKAFNKALLKDLDGVYYPQAKIYTNQDGLLYLANLDDGNNRPLFTPDVTSPDTYRYRGKEIVVIPNSTLPSVTVSTKNYAPFFVGDMKAYLTFFERQGMELATSSELYFRKYGTAIRAVVRWGVTIMDEDAMLALAVELS